MNVLVSILRHIGLFVLTYALMLLTVLLVMPLPEEPMFRYVVLAMPALAAAIGVSLWHGMWTPQPSGAHVHRSTTRSTREPLADRQVEDTTGDS